MRRVDARKEIFVKAFALTTTLALCIAACSSTSIEGTIDGKTFAATSAIVGSSWSPQGGGTWLILTDVDDPCQALKDNKRQKNTSTVFIILQEKSGGTVTSGTKAGEYKVSSATDTPDGLSATVSADQFDASCASTLPDLNKKTGNSGTITVDAEIKDNSGASGTLSIDFPGGSKLTGEFDAEHCDGTVNLAAGAPACG